MAGRGLALAAALACLAGPAQAHWEYTRWGMTQQQVVAASRGAVQTLPPAQRRPVPNARMEYRAAGTFRSGTLRLTVAFGFDARNGGLVCVSAQAEAAQADALRARMERPPGTRAGPRQRGHDARLDQARRDRSAPDPGPPGGAAALRARGVTRRAPCRYSFGDRVLIRSKTRLRTDGSVMR
jgi:hypothetical protein